MNSIQLNSTRLDSTFTQSPIAYSSLRQFLFFLFSSSTIRHPSSSNSTLTGPSSSPINSRRLLCFVYDCFCWTYRIPPWHPNSITDPRQKSSIVTLRKYSTLPSFRGITLLSAHGLIAHIHTHTPADTHTNHCKKVLSNTYILQLVPSIPSPSVHSAHVPLSCSLISDHP